MTKNQKHIIYKSKLKKQQEDFREYLSSCNRHLLNKQIKEIKYKG